MSLLTVLALLIVLDVAACLVGRDSRDGRDWSRVHDHGGPTTATSVKVV